MYPRSEPSKPAERISANKKLRKNGEAQEQNSGQKHARTSSQAERKIKTTHVQRGKQHIREKSQPPKTTQKERTGKTLSNTHARGRPTKPYYKKSTKHKV